MGRHVGRSRGCQVCIRRRIKCDETTPECIECTSSGRECDGPLRGTLFLDMSAKVRASVDVASDPNTVKRRRPKARGVLYGTSDTKELLQTKCNSTSIETIKIPSTYQPHKAEIFQLHYIAHFMKSHDSCIHSWITQLPNIISSPACSSEIYAIRAATMAFYSKVTGREDIELEAARWYSRGLESQRKYIQSGPEMLDDETCISRAVFAAILFSTFETIICTNPTGWIHHFTAAGKLLQLAGPKSCQRGLMHSFFRSVRIASFTISLTADEPSPFAADEWCNIPFVCQPKTVFDKLIDILLQLPSLLPYRSEMRRLRYENPLASKILRLKLGTTAQQILDRLTDFWDEQSPDFDPHYDDRLAEISSIVEQDETDQRCLPINPLFRSSFSAYFASMYDSGCIIALSQLAAASHSSEAFQKQMVIHGASILVSVSYHEAQDSINDAAFSMIFPLKLLCLLSPSETQRVNAQDALARWGGRRGLVSSCEMEPSFLDRRHG